MEKRLELKRFIFESISNVAETEIPQLELEIASLKRTLKFKEDFLSLKFKLVNEARKEYGFVLNKVPIEQNGPYRLDIGEQE